MSRRERVWPLVVFTLSTQAVVGGTVAAGCAQFFLGRRVSPDAAATLLRGPVLGLLLGLGLAMVASTGHLARPWAAWRALRHVRTSWVSVEVALTIGYGAVLVAFTALDWWAVPSARDVAALTMTALVLGGCLILAMARIYRLSTRPAWDHVCTPVSFLVTAGMLGPSTIAAQMLVSTWLGAAAGAAEADAEEALGAWLRLLVGASCVAAAAEMAVIWWQARIRRLASRVAGLVEPPRDRRRNRVVAAARMVATAGACGLMTWWIVPERVGRDLGTWTVVMLVGAVLLLWAEAIAGRVRFYDERPVAGL